MSSCIVCDSADAAPAQSGGTDPVTVTTPAARRGITLAEKQDQAADDHPGPYLHAFRRGMPPPTRWPESFRRYRAGLDARCHGPREFIELHQLEAHRFPDGQDARRS
ncbi:hypothetical protein SAMN04515665_12933 [Blastococcus sp. DSM 46786]|uniref:hypothetical protein n=1 Tax=Blastococcus sp. DSM 46786 TaxID=1798227 RepID=UPI0008BEC9FF|nr:hypothetical protein [Blastococcus sp. DSM 46786]SEM08239.1 hypothetical protein SAMN04515665_12933 [Blastococcus sp. DSM 46786]